MDVFAISPAPSRTLWILVVICAILALVWLALAYTAYACRTVRVEVDRHQVALVGDFWGRQIPLDRINVAGVRVVDLNQEAAYAPKRRTLGTGLPGYASGWFRLHNGEKALVYLTERRQVVYVPTLDGYCLLLSVVEPQRFLERLQGHSG